MAAASTVGLPAQVPQSKERPATIGKVNVVGCVELEKDYRARMAKDKGGVLGTGVGVGNEFILTGVTTAPAAKSAAPVSGDYKLTGKLEPGFVRQVGRQVEGVGTIDAKSASSEPERFRD
jgi:hypothetical protein